MSNEHPNNIDPVALLSSLAPPPMWNERTAIAGPDANQRAARTYARVRSGELTTFTRPRNTLRIVTGVIVALSLGGAAAAAILWERTPEQINSLTCWSDPTNPPPAQVGVKWDGTTPPADRCAAAWVDGVLGANGPPAELQACVTDAGLTAVVPGDSSTCGALGLAKFVDPATDDNVGDLFVVAELEDGLVTQFNTGRCALPDDAQSVATDLIEELGLVGWDVEVFTTFSAEEPCATVAVDSTSDTVFIVPAGRND